MLRLREILENRCLEFYRIFIGENLRFLQGNRILFLNTRIYGQLQAKSMNLSKYGFPYLGDGSEKWRSYPHIVPKNLDAIALPLLGLNRPIL
jgi:hypothetical protein